MSQKGKVSATSTADEHEASSLGVEGNRRTRTVEIETISSESRWSRSPRVLVVASYPAYGQGLAELLRVGDRRVELATNGIHALLLAEHLQPNVVLCELELRGRPDAPGLARALRADLLLRNVLLVGLTVKDPEVCEPEALEAGFDLVLGKSGDVTPLEEVVQNTVLRNR